VKAHSRSWRARLSRVSSSALDLVTLLLLLAALFFYLGIRQRQHQTQATAATEEHPVP
jgi:preprotein translocase subunit YajC